MSVLRGNLDLLQSNKTTIVDVIDPPISDGDLVSIYRWLDTMEFSRPKKTAIHRDFADGVMMGELVAHYIPKIVNTRYYVAASNSQTKVANWQHINEKVLKRIRFQLTPSLIKSISDARPGMIERVLKPLRLILLRGPKAVAPPSTKLENIKSRFMDIERTYLNRTPTPTVPSAPSSKSPTPGKISASPASRFTCQSPLPPKNANGNLIATPRNRPTTSGSNSLPKPVPKVNKPNTAPAAHHQLTKLNMKMSPKSNEPSSYLPKPDANRTEKKPILTRPSTAKPTSSALLSPTTKIEEEKDVELDADTTQQETRNSRKAAKGIFPPSSSWLPVDDEQNDIPSKIPHKESDEEPHSDSDRGYSVLDEFTDVDDESVDDEIYCSGYDADEDGAVGASYFEDSLDDDNEASPSPKGNSSKRKVKRVIKYEYREEYILNGMSYQLPNEQEMEAVRKNYQSPGNKDPNCRGYGFV